MQMLIGHGQVPTIMPEASDKLTVNIVKNCKYEIRSQLVTERRYFTLLKALNGAVLFKDFENEVFDNAKKFIEEVALLNSELKKTNMYFRIRSKMEMIETLNNV